MGLTDARIAAARAYGEAQGRAEVVEPVRRLGTDVIELVTPRDQIAVISAILRGEVVPVAAEDDRHRAAAEALGIGGMSLDRAEPVLSVSDLQRVLDELRAEWVDSTLCGDYRKALADLAARLDLGEGN